MILNGAVGGRTVIAHRTEVDVHISVEELIGKLSLRPNVVKLVEEHSIHVESKGSLLDLKTKTVATAQQSFLVGYVAGRPNLCRARSRDEVVIVSAFRKIESTLRHFVETISFRRFERTLRFLPIGVETAAESPIACELIESIESSLALRSVLPADSRW